MSIERGSPASSMSSILEDEKDTVPVLSRSQSSLEMAAAYPKQEKHWTWKGMQYSSTYDEVSSPIVDEQEERIAFQNKKFQSKIAHYSTMRVHLKKAQFCLEQEKRNSFYKDLIIYLIFLVLLLAAVIQLPIHFPFEQTAAVRDLFFDEEFANLSIKKNFDDIMVAEEMWQWVNGPLLAGFYQLPLVNHRRIGSIEFRTGRVIGELCQDVHDHKDLFLFGQDVCYPLFDRDVEETTPFGSAESSPLNRQYLWTDSLTSLTRSLTFTSSVWNGEKSFGTGGYPVYLPRDSESSGREIVQQLEQDFIQASTRYMSVSFSLYNPSSDLFTVIQVLFEFSTTDYIEKSARTSSLKLLRVSDGWQLLRDHYKMGLLALATLFFLRQEIKDLLSTNILSYWKSLWNILDIAQVGLLIALLVSWGQYLAWSNSLWDDLFDAVNRNCDAVDQTQGSECFVDLHRISFLVIQIGNLAGVVSLFSVLIVFKYLRLNSRMNLLWRTLRFASLDLLAFVIIFLIIFIGYAVMGFLVFGSQVRAYHSLSSSLAACFQMLLGAFDYERLYVANARITGFFFFSFMILIYLILVNMFIAIMSEYYSVAQQEKKEKEENRKKLLKGNNNDEDSYLDDVEYDILKQLENYFRGLQLRLQLSQDLALRRGQRVLLIDADYLQAERQRLRLKFKTAARVVMICRHLMISPFIQEKERIHDDRQSQRSSIRESNAETIEFPVTYLPLRASSAKAHQVLSCLVNGSKLYFDDGSLTADRVTLQVIGHQEDYIPRKITSLMRIDQRQSDAFGLRTSHPGLCSDRHIRCCRVIYHGRRTLEGYEKCVFPVFTWIKHFIRNVFGRLLVEGISRIFCCRKRRKPRNRLINDRELETLINYNLQDTGRGLSCRFDELVRNFRILLAKKMHTEVSLNLEQQVFEEAIAFVERFPSALMPLDKRELEGYKYTPQPVDTGRIRLPRSVIRLSELLSQNAHEVWSQGRIAQGWQWGPQRDNALKLHPDLISYEALTEEDKQYDRDTSIQALKVIQAFGYVLEPPDDLEKEIGNIVFGLTDPYVPHPIETDDIHVPDELKALIELLAENTHEIWAQMRMKQGWTFGPRRDDQKREHNGLVPYIYLTREEKELDRNTAIQTVKLILRAGFAFRHKSKTGNGATTFRLFGRSENPDTRTISSTVAVAKGTLRAKDTLLNRFKPTNSAKTISNSMSLKEKKVRSSSASFALDRKASQLKDTTMVVDEESLDEEESTGPRRLISLPEEQAAIVR